MTFHDWHCYYTGSSTTTHRHTHTHAEYRTRILHKQELSVLVWLLSLFWCLPINTLLQHIQTSLVIGWQQLKASHWSIAILSYRWGVHLCVCVCISVRISVCVCVCVCVILYIYMYVCMCGYVCVCVCVCVWVQCCTHSLHNSTHWCSSFFKAKHSLSASTRTHRHTHTHHAHTILDKWIPDTTWQYYQSTRYHINNISCLHTYTRTHTRTIYKNPENYSVPGQSDITHIARVCTSN